MSKRNVLCEAVLLLIVLQAVRELLEWLIGSYIPDSQFADRMITMSVMLLLTGVMVLYAWIRKTPLSVFPEHFGKFYVVFTIIVAVVFITTPANFTGGYQAVMLLIYGSVVTPVYEELIFRGYLWNRLDRVFSKEVYTCIMSVALFTLWHLGYMASHIMAGNWNAVLWKLAAGLGYGVVLGIVRLKYKNCYICMLIHGLLNDFMI